MGCGLLTHDQATQDGAIYESRWGMKNASIKSPFGFCFGISLPLFTDGVRVFLLHILTYRQRCKRLVHFC